MKWTRCNNCYSRADLAKEPFTLTKCGHAYCNRCIGQAEKQCMICNTVGVATIRLIEPLEANIALYFTSMKDTLQQLVYVANFQEEQIGILMKRFNEIDKKYLYAKELYYNMEVGYGKMHKKYKQQKEEDMKKIRKLENEIIQLRFVLNGAQNSPYNNFCSTGNSNIAHAMGSHPCKNRNQTPDAKVAYSTPRSRNTKISSISSNSDRQYLAQLAQADRIFQVPMRKGFRSAETRASGSTNSTSASVISGRLQSLMMSRF